MIGVLGLGGPGQGGLRFASPVAVGEVQVAVPVVRRQVVLAGTDVIADVGIREGVAAILQAGGSMNDYASIVACNEANPQVTMMFTGQRSFKH